MNVVDGGVQNVRTALKRRGILAGAAAFLAMGLAKASEQVARAADGGNLILGSAGDANNTASSTTRLFTGGNPGFRVVASVPTAAAIRGEATPSGSLSGVAGLVGSTAASSQPVAPSGVFGRGDDAGQLGVYGFSQGNIGLRGDSGANYGVYGTSTLTALRGEASGAGVGVVGVALGLGITLSLCALLMEEMTFHLYQCPSDLLKLVLVSVLENFGYRQLNSYWKLIGLIRWIRGTKAEWGNMVRSASWQSQQARPGNH